MGKNRNIRKFWTSNEIEFLKENYSKIRSSEIAEQIGKTVGAIYQAANKWGLKSANDGRFTRGKSNSPDTQFKKDLVPHAFGREKFD